MRTLLISPQMMIRAALRSLLGQLDGIKVIVEASNPQDALAAVGAHQFDLAVFDASLSKKARLEIIAGIKANQPAVHFILLHPDCTPRILKHNLGSGVLGHISKYDDASALQAAVHAVATGNSYISPALSRMMLATQVGRPDDLLARLTPRQRQIVPHLANGCSTKAIAADLGLSKRTVDSHRAALMMRLGLSDLAGLIRLALRKGLISLDPPDEEPKKE